MDGSMGFTLIQKLHQEHFRVNRMAEGIDKDAYKDGLYFAEKVILEAYELSDQKSFMAELLKGKQLLQASNLKMAKHMHMELSTYNALETGERVLNKVKRDQVRERMKGLLDICGINTEQLKPK